MPRTNAQAPNRTGIRPGLWVAAALFFSAVGLALFALARSGERDEPLARAEDAREPARRGARPSSRSGDEASSSPTLARAGGGYRHHDWSTESELSRRTALGLPHEGFWTRGPTPELEHDPQLAAMWRSFSWRRDPDADAPPLPFEPTAHRAELIEAEGEVASSPSSCQVRVLPVDASRFNCVVRVMCDGSVLYPDPRQSAGYVPCELEDGRPVRAVDDGHTHSDGDPLVDLDLARGTITVQDYAPDGSRRYRATLRITS